MLTLKWLLIAAGVAGFGVAGAALAYNVYLAMRFHKLTGAGEPEATRESGPSRPVRSALAMKVFGWSWVPLLVALSIVIVPEGAGGIRISQISGVRPRTLYPGVHLVVPLVERVAVYDLRDRLFTMPAPVDKANRGELLTVQAREGLTLGLSVAVRYRLDPQKLAYIHANLAQPVDTEIVAPVVATTFRDLAPNYVVREVFSTQREEFRRRAAQTITRRLGQDGIVVKEVLLRDVRLPAEYAKGLEDMLLKEQEGERMGFETTIREKQVRIAELEADAQKVRQVKRSEADAASRVIAANAESDAMQYTLPLKQKQIEQTRLEAQARKEATVQNAEAAAESKIIDSRAEVERRRLLAGADANTIRLTAAANAERMQQEAVVLKENPLLIQKIVAERLSDKLQIIMVPTDGRNFFASDVLRSAFAGAPPAAGPAQPQPEPALPVFRQQAQVSRRK
jgi:regulator of protease activity HflC (stomatin/prohibitin superfamily)